MFHVVRDNCASGGSVALVGAGPGDPELLTLKALRLLEAADVVVHDRLVSAEILALASPTAELIDVGKAPKRHPVPQDKINEILVSRASTGADVVRLKGGDPYIFGRGSEEAMVLREQGIDVTVVPGITAAQGVAAVTDVPLTHRGLATGVRFVTGHCRSDVPLDLDWQGLADPETTLVVYMGAANIAEISMQLRAAGMPGDLPVMAVLNGTRRDEQRILSQLDGIEKKIDGLIGAGPVLFVIGKVVSLYSSRPIADLAEELPGMAVEFKHA